MMISVAEATRLILEHRPARNTIRVPVGEAAGHILSEDIVAKISKPPAAVSAMDGYAVRLADVCDKRATLQVIGEAPAGTPFKGTVSEGQAIRIFTGGTLPDGADHIVIQEDVNRDGDTILCLDSYKNVQHVRDAGLDFREGDIILSAGVLLSAYSASLAAAANHDTLPVYRPLNVALLSNGDELRPPGSQLSPGEIISANPIGLGALLNDWCADAIDLGIAKDSLEAIERKISTAPDGCNIFVAIGGASVGDHDHMRRAFLNAGFEMIFEKVAVRPGKPTWFAKRGDQLVLGLPGNPASALVCANLFLQPLVLANDGERLIAAIASTPIAKNGPRESYSRAIATLSSDAKLSVRPLPNQDSSLLTPLTVANCLIRRPPNQMETEVGELVEILLIQPISF